VIGNANLVKKTPFPRLVLPLAMVLANLVNFLLSLVVAGIYLAATGARLEGAAWLAPAVATNVALCAGVSLVVSCVNVFFRDVQQMTSIVTVAWFFLSPVIYTGDVVGRAFPALERLYYLNPMAGLLALYRRALLGTPLPPAGFLGVSVAAAWALLLAGGLLFQRLQVRFADEL
jgi:ABC-2 type transport system permease protein